MGRMSVGKDKWRDNNYNYSVADREYQQLSGKTKFCVVCDTKFKGMDHDKCKDSSCRCPQHVLDRGLSVDCLYCVSKLTDTHDYVGMHHHECKDKNCKCPHHVSIQCWDCRKGKADKKHKECKLKNCWCPEHVTDHKPEPMLGDMGQETGYYNTPTGVHILSIHCSSLNHSVCGDDKCECPCHDTVDSKSKWKCPRCRAWVWEKQAKICEQCHIQAMRRIHAVEASKSLDSGCKLWVHENCKERNTPRADACDNCKKLYDQCAKSNSSNCKLLGWKRDQACENCKVLYDHKTVNSWEDLSPEEQEILWAASINSYPHKNMRNRLVILSDDESERQKRREWEKKGIQKAIDL